MAKFVGVKFQMIGEDSSYVAYKKSECKDSCDASAFDEVIKSGEVITMGMLIACPHYEA